MAPTRTYRLSPDAINKSTLRYFWIVVAASAALAVILWWTSGPVGIPGWFLLIAPLVVGLVFIPLAYHIGLRKRFRTEMMAQEWIFCADFLVYHRLGAKEITVRRQEIRSLEENRWGLTVQTADGFTAILIPFELDGFEELKLLLTQWAPLESASARRLSQLLSASSTVAFFLLDAARGWVQDPRFVLLGELIFAATTAWWVLKQLRNPHLSRKEKFLYCIIMLPILVALDETFRRWRTP